MNSQIVKKYFPHEKNIFHLFFFLLCILLCNNIYAQADHHTMSIIASDVVTFDSLAKPSRLQRNDTHQLDLIDLVTGTHKNGATTRKDSGAVKSTKLHISAIPAIGYTLQTSIAGVVTANGTFYADSNSNLSSVISSISYSLYNQIIFPLKSSIWTKDNKFNIITDWRFLRYPSFTYGLGGNTSLSDGYMIYYSVIRLHQTLLSKLATDIYAGIGYNTDIYWDIKDQGQSPKLPSDFQKYGEHTTEYESGITLNFLYDSRQNPINPVRGGLFNVIYCPNIVQLGNATSWQSLVLDTRKYLRLPLHSNNLLALWNFEWLTIDGKPPYLMLPNTGGDPYSNPGRGYIQGRFRGRNMAYAEAEYRFALSRNGLVGGVVFGNAQSFTEETSGHFEQIAPGYGAGVRLKVNKFSRTNLAVDYGFGIGGSRGLFVNLGEIF